MPRFSIFGYYGQGNAGDEAILAALTDGIRAEFKDPIIGVYTANIQETEKSHNVKGYRFFGLDIKSIIVGLLGRSRSIYIKSVLHFLRTDVVIIGGGGLFFDTTETNEWIYGHLNTIHRAKRFGKKVALVGISVGPLHHEDSKKAIGEAFPKVDLICVRDEKSRELLMECGVQEEKINIIPDLVFTLKSAPQERVREILIQEGFPIGGSRNIVLTPCCYNINQRFWIERYAEFCEKAINELGVNIWFVPMQRNDNHDDLTAVRSIIQNLSKKAAANVYTLNGIYTAREVQGIIGQANFAFAERLHGSIMAINNCIPVLSIAYMPKVDGVLSLANMASAVISMKDFLDGDRHNFIFDEIKKHLASANDNRRLLPIAKEAEQSFLKLAEI